jgi:cyclophilin family peptidyl-prolyl cis-trans isomerase
MTGAVPMAQVLHHADDHRSHILSIIGARGLTVPALDIWAYAESAGQMQVDPSRRFSATVHTSRGDFIIALAGPNSDWSAVSRFVYVAQNESYNGLALHRVDAGMVLECGDALERGAGGSPPTERVERRPSSWSRGTAGMASDTSGIGYGFFITLADAAFPEPGAYRQVGHVSEGMEVADRIEAGDSVISVEITVS